MQKTPLKASPLQILSSEFININLTSCDTNIPHGGGTLSVEHDIQLNPAKDENTWIVRLMVKLQPAHEDSQPPYTGTVSIKGNFKVSDKYNGDHERLIRITAVSMLYGSIREMLANLTARSANGLMLLPSVSFYYTPESPAPTTTKKRKAPARKGQKSNKAKHSGD